MNEETNLQVGVYFVVETIFPDWLERQLIQRGWKPADLAKAAGLPDSTISRILNSLQKTGPDVARSIAKALNEPPEKIFRLAGILPLGPEVVMEEEEMLFVFRSLPRSRRQFLVEMMRGLSGEPPRSTPPAIQEPPAMYQVDNGPVVPLPKPRDIIDDLEALDSVELQTVQDFIRWRLYEQDRRRNSFGRKREPAIEPIRQPGEFFIPPAFEGIDLTPEQIEALRAVHHRLTEHVKKISPAERETLLNETAAIQLALIERSAHLASPGQSAETNDPASEDKIAIDNH